MDISSSGMTLDRIATEESLAQLAEPWDRLSECADAPNVFMTYAWFHPWYRALANEDTAAQRQLCVVTCGRDGQIQALCPLVFRIVARGGFTIRKLEFLGGHADYNDLLLGVRSADTYSQLAAFLDQTQDEWDLVDLRDLRDLGPSLKLIQTALARCGLQYQLLPEPDRYVYLRIDASWQEMLGRMSHNGRQMLRKKQRRLGRAGLAVRIVEDPRQEPDVLPKLAAIEKQKQVGGAASEPLVAAYLEVFQSLFDTLGPRGWLYLALMEDAGRLVAWRLGFRCGRSLWDYSTAYDRSYAELSPGTMLIPAILDYGFSHGYTEHDFLRGAEPYKLRWSDEYHPTYRLLIWSRRWRSRFRKLVYFDLKSHLYRWLGR